MDLSVGSLAVTPYESKEPLAAAAGAGASPAVASTFDRTDIISEARINELMEQDAGRIRSEVVRRLPEAFRSFAADSLLLKQSFRVNGFAVHFIRDNQIYLDFKEIPNALNKGVRQMIDLVNGRRVVVLLPKESDGDDICERQRWQRECNFLMNVPDVPYFPKTYGRFPIPRRMPEGEVCEYGIVQEHCPYDLYTYVGQKKSPEDQLKACRDVALAIHHLHAQGKVHRDIKLDNFLVDSQGNIKLTDFGCAAATGNLELFDRPGTGLCRSPEEWKRIKAYLLKNKSFLSQKVDIAAGKSQDMWAAGLTFYAIVTGGCPYFLKTLQDFPDAKEDDFKAVWKASRCVRYLGKPNTEDHKKFQRFIAPELHRKHFGRNIVLRSIILGCLELDPTKRLTSEQVLKILEPEPISAAASWGAGAGTPVIASAAAASVEEGAR